MKDFDSILASLNDKQRQAVDTIYGPVLVIAGPGSGKTQLLAVRIANILRETDAHPSNILCLTFTDNAAKNMRERLRGIIGQDAYKVAIHTFHTFGLEVLHRFRHRIMEDEEQNPIDDIESSRVFETIRENLSWDHPWKKQTRLRTLRNTIQLLKQSGIEAEDLSSILSINEQIVNSIRPIVAEYAQKIFSLGQKKEEKKQKTQLFGAFSEKLATLLSDAIQEHHLIETLAPTLLRAIQGALDNQNDEYDTKSLTLWKNTWLEKENELWVLKDERKNTESAALLEIYRSYTAILKEKNLIDFSDMILRALRLIETDESVRATLREQYQWVMIDEYQDTNDAQLRLVTSMLEGGLDSPNLFAVGDDDQSIYKFQGANTRNIRLFLELYSDTELIILERNYRSKKEIIDFSRGIMTHKGEIEVTKLAEKTFHAHHGDGGEVYTLQFGSELEEITWVVNDIEKQIQNGVKYEEIAVITKKNSTLEAVAKLLLTKHIPVFLSKEENIFANEMVILTCHILEYIASLSNSYGERDDLLLGILAHPAWGIHRLTLWEISRKISQARKESSKSWIETLRTHTDKNISKIAHFFIELHIRSHTKRLEDIIDYVTGADGLILSEEYSDEGGAREQFRLTLMDEETLFHSPLYSYFFSEARLEREPTLYASYLANIRKLIESVRSFRKNEGRLLLSDFAEYMRLIHEYDIHVSASTLIGSEHAVQCLTAHKAKGLEYDCVYAIGLTERNYKRGKNDSSPLPSNFTLAPEKDNDDDIRRLIYTVSTRARERLILTHATKNLSEKSDILISVLGHVENWEQIPADDTNTGGEFLQTELHDILALPYTGDEKEFLHGILTKNFTLSATALQNFLDVTSGGPKSFLANNVLRFPQAKSEAAIYGTAIHKALEDFFKDYKLTKTFKKSLLFESFAKKLQEDGLETSKESDYLERGKANLEKLYQKLTTKSYGEIHLEYRFSREGGGTYLSDIELSGAIDRIELTPDGKIIITDYKTGGGFTSLDGGSGYEAVKKWKYELQLTFYALLFSLSPRWSPWKERIFHLFFVEENAETGSFDEVITIIQEGQIERLKKIITAVMTKIRHLDFPDTSHYEPTVEGIRQFEEDLISGQI